MTASLIRNPYTQFLTAEGLPAAAGTVNIYQNKTATDANVYTTAALNVAQSNPYTLNANGQIENDVWVNEVVTILVKDSTGATIFEADDLNNEGTASTLLALLTPVGGAFFYTDVIASGHTMSANEVVRGDSTGNVFKYVSGTVVDPETDTPYNQETGVSNSGAWVDVTIASAPIHESDITAITDPIETDVAALELEVDNLQLQLVPDDYFTGLTLSNDVASPDDTVDIAIGSAQDTSNTARMALTSAFEKVLSSNNFATGTGNDGLADALSVTADTWYRVFLIGKADGTVDVGFDSANNSDASALLASTAAANFVYYRQIGWVKTDATSDIYKFIQTGNYIQWTDRGNDITVTGASSLPSSRTNYEVKCPPSTLVDVNIQLGLRSGNGAGTYCYGMITSPDGTDVTPTEDISNIFGKSANLNEGGGYVNQSNHLIKANSSSEIGLKFDYDVSTNTYLYGTTNGFYFNP